jgi:cell wall-associated NlpC family hydrolase
MRVASARPFGAVVAITLGLSLLPSIAIATPSDPDDSSIVDQSYTDAVNEARTNEQNKAQQIAALETQLVQLQMSLEAAQIEAQSKAEDYNVAVVAYEAAVAAAELAAQQLATAEAAREDARADLGLLAVEAYKTNGSMAELEALLSADGLEEVLARSEAADLLGGQTDAIVQRFRATSLVAAAVKVRADEAQAEMAAAKLAAEEAFTAAQAAADAAAAAVASAEATRQNYLAQLAVLRQTTLEAETARQEAIDAERRRREEEAARLEAERQARIRAEQERIAREEAERLRQEQARQQQASQSQSQPAQLVSQPYQPPTTTAVSSSDSGNAAVAWALAQVGKPYAIGGNGPWSFDCSGLTSQAWSAAGRWIGRTSRAQYVNVARVSLNEMRPGDLVFWARDTSDPSTIYHVAMYIGGGQIVEAPYPGLTVQVRAVPYGRIMPYAGRP